MAEAPGCARPTGAVVGADPPQQEGEQSRNEEVMEMEVAKVGQKAPDFKAPAFYQGKFTEVNLVDHLGNWVLLCFYPGDFTFV